MATTTFCLVCPSGSWTEVASGATSKSFGLVVDSTAWCKIAIAASAPAADAADYLMRENGHELSLELGAADKVFAQGYGAPSVLRGYLVSV